MISMTHRHDGGDAMLKMGCGLAVLVVLSACVPVSTGGAGQMSNGAPVTGTLSSDPAKRLYRATVTSPGRWTCNSEFGAPSTPTAERNVPLICSNGATGVLTLVGNQFAQQITGAFRLSSGEAGSVTFGNV